MRRRALCLAVAGWVSLAGAEAAQEFRLPNGLQVLLVESHERPLVRLELRTTWNAAEEPRGKEGMGGFLGDMLRTCGAGLLNRDAFQRFLENRALKFAFSMTPRAFAWSVLADSQGQDDAFESLALAATRPSFDGPAVEARRRIYLKTLKDQTPRSRAEARFLGRIGDPSQPRIPDVDPLNRIEFQDLLQLSRRVLRPERSVLVIYGDMNLSQAKQLSMLHLGAWGPGPEKALAPAREPIPAQSIPTRTWVVVDGGGTLQVRVGAPMPAGRGLSGAMLAACTWWADRIVRSRLPFPLAQADLRISPEGAWLVKATAPPGSSASETLEAVRQLVRRLGGEAAGPADLEPARQAWNAARENRGLHPEQEAASLADQALATAGTGQEEGGFSGAGLQAALRRLFSGETCLYFIQGPVPRDPDWLAKAGLGPVETLR